MCAHDHKIFVCVHFMQMFITWFENKTWEEEKGAQNAGQEKSTTVKTWDYEIVANIWKVTTKIQFFFLFISICWHFCFVSFRFRGVFCSILQAFGTFYFFDFYVAWKQSHLHDLIIYKNLSSLLCALWCSSRLFFPRSFSVLSHLHIHNQSAI